MANISSSGGRSYTTHNGQSLVTVSYDFAVAQGDVPNHSIMFKFGHNVDVDIATVPEDIWPVGGAYAGFSATAERTLNFVSDNAADNQAGTGARSVTVTGLDGGYSVISETVLLHPTDGTIAVTSTLEFLRVNDFRVNFSGTGGTNAGNILCFQTTDGHVMGTIEAGSGLDHNAQFTVPGTTTLYVLRLYLNLVAGGSSREATVVFETRASGGSLWVRHTEFILITSDHVYQDPPGSFKIPAETDCRWRIISASTNDSQFAMWWSGILETE